MAPSRTRTKRRSDARTAERSVAGTMAAATAGFRGDLLGLACAALGILCGLGLYSSAGGPVVQWLADAVGTVFGPLGYVVPVALVALGVLGVRGSRSANAPDADGADDPADAPDPLVVRTRRTVGVVLVVFVVLGLADLWRGRPGFSGTREQFTHAGGFLGTVVGTPLHAVLGTAGATVVCVFVGLAGLVLVTGVSVSRAAEVTARVGSRVGRAFSRRVGALFRLDGAVDEPVEVTGYAAFADEGPDEEVPDEERDTTLVLPDSDTFPDAVGEATAVDGPYDQDRDHQPLEPIGEASQLEIDLEGQAPKRRRAWKLPPRKLLQRAGAQQVDKDAIAERGHMLEHALAEHGVETRLVGMTVGPTVTRYELELGPGVKVARVTSLQKDIAYAMATPDVRILAPIPGRHAIGVEVPNTTKQLVTVGDILASREAREAKHPLDAAVGRDIQGRAVMANLAKMPHVLIAGATGAGKSSCINTLLTSLLMRDTPDDLRLILVDPKRVELGQYNRLPHLLTEVVTNPKKAANALAWTVKEMERRYDLLSEVGVRDVTGYNAAFDRGDLVPPPGSERVYERLPFILVVVDELNDLMMVAARDVEASITRIAQMARAVGIHLVIATQRPSVNVITGVIKANIPARWAFAVSSLADSRVILDQPGAERLLGRGDMLLLDPSSSVPTRVQGSWVTEEEVRAVVAHWRRQEPEVVYDDTVQGADETESRGGGGGGAGGSDDDELFDQAMDLVVRSQLGSTSMLQRKLRVGFARAGRLMDLLEQRGVVGPSEGSKARAVLMTLDEYEGGSDAPTSGTTDPSGAPSADEAEDDGDFAPTGAAETPG